MVWSTAPADSPGPVTGRAASSLRSGTSRASACVAGDSDRALCRDALRIPPSAAKPPPLRGVALLRTSEPHHIAVLTHDDVPALPSTQPPTLSPIPPRCVTPPAALLRRAASVNANRYCGTAVTIFNNSRSRIMISIKSYLFIW